MSKHKHMIIAYDPTIPTNPNPPGLAKNCLFRIGLPIKTLELAEGSRGVIYQTGDQVLVGELCITRIENIEKPPNAEMMELYKKLTSRPVAPTEKEYFGPGHIFFNEFYLYHPSVEWATFATKAKELGKPHSLPIRSFRYIDDDELEVIHELTNLVKVQR